jgi:hypothetical protein
MFLFCRGEMSSSSSPPPSEPTTVVVVVLRGEEYHVVRAGQKTRNPKPEPGIPEPEPEIPETRILFGNFG